MSLDFRIVVYGWFGLALHISACNVEDSPQMASSSLAVDQERVSKVETPLSIATIVTGHRSGIREPLQNVIRNQDEWKALWERHSSTDNNALTVQLLAFNRE